MSRKQITFLVAFIGIFSASVISDIRMSWVPYDNSNDLVLYYVGVGVGILLIMSGGYGLYLLIKKLYRKIIKSA